MAKILMYGMIAALGAASFIVALLYLTKGHDAELVTLLLAPVSGLCLAIIMHFCDISFRYTVSFSLQQGNFSFKIYKS